jgi:hypothetical protein
LIDKCEITIILYLIVSKLNPVQRSVSLSSSCDRVQYNTGASEKAWKVSFETEDRQVVVSPKIHPSRKPPHNIAPRRRAS